jgi:hypothetical protein
MARRFLQHGGPRRAAENDLVYHVLDRVKAPLAILDDDWAGS